MSTGIGLLGNNMFVYCNNNPKHYVDSQGNIPQEDYYRDDEDLILTKLQDIIFFATQQIKGRLSGSLSNNGSNGVGSGFGGGGYGNNVTPKQTNNPRGVGGKGWEGDQTWRQNVETVRNGGTITGLNGGIPTIDQGIRLIILAGGVVERIEGPHSYPNPHTYPHINYTINNKHATLQVLSPE